MMLPLSTEALPGGAVAAAGTPQVVTLRLGQAGALASAFILALLALTLVPRVPENPHLWWSLVGAGTVLLVLFAALFTAASRSGRQFTLEIALRKQHYLQACAQASVFAYWGYYWSEVYSFVPLIVAQLAFAYGFDMLLAWSRRDVYALGFGPFPVVLSMNLFLWFKPDWFYCQFLMIAIGFAAKEFIRWNKNGRRTHIFNPSSFPLALVSVVLIVTHTTHLTWGPDIAETQFRPPYIYLLIFLVGLPGQFFFGVTSMTMSAVATMYVFGLLYHAVTGTYFFFETIPIAVFLGMHLLFTDPSTSPRTEAGRIVYGVLYALSVVALAPMLGFYDKLLPVPVLNLTIKLIDCAMTSPVLKRLDPTALLAALAPRRRHIAYMSVWTALFVLMSTTHGLGHTSRGYWLPGWQQACGDGRPNACEKLAQLEETYCRDGESGWACNDLGLLLAERRTGNIANAGATFQRACSLGFSPACENVAIAAAGAGKLQQAPPRLVDYPVLLMEGQGRLTSTPFDLYRRACQQGWMTGCESLALSYLEGQGTPRDPVRAAAVFDKACAAGLSSACASVAYQFSRGEGVARNDATARVYLQRSCELGMASACGWLKDAQINSLPSQQ